MWADTSHGENMDDFLLFLIFAIALCLVFAVCGYIAERLEDTDS